MPKERGTKVLVFVGGTDTNPEDDTYTKLGGQRTGTLNISAEQIDTTDKNSDDWGTSMAGPRAFSVTCGGQPDWPDTNGLKVVNDRHVAGDRINVKIVLNSAGAGWFATCAITEFELDGPYDDATSYAITFNATAAPVAIAP